MAVPVDIFVKDQAVVPAPVEDVTVNVYNPSTLALITGALTDVDGKAGLLLDGGNYEVRFYKYGYFFDGPKQIVVQEPVVTTNKFDVSALSLYDYPSSGSPDLCRVSGVFVDFRGQPVRNALLRIATSSESGLQNPKVWNKAMVATDALEVRTDDNGYVSVNLMRGGEYYVSFYGESDVVWCMKVPDAFAWDFTDLVHPYPVSLDFDDTVVPAGVGQSITIAVGEKKEIPFSLLFSDGRSDHKQVIDWFTFQNEDGDIVSLVADYDGGKIWVEGLAAGSSDITLEMKPDVAPIHWPAPEIQYESFTVVVTP